jgi:uncharacterized protein with FMN-binding domain
MAKKLKKIQMFRHIMQVVLFFLLPGLYTLAFSEFKQIYQMIIDGNFNFVQSLPGLIEFLTVIILTILLGRFFCGWFCAFGSYNDWIYLISKNIFKINFKVNEKVDSILKYTKYLILVVILAVVCTIESNIFNGTSPWDAFAQITDLSSVLSNLIIGLIFLILITIGAMFIERFFCRYLCPLGAIFTIFSRISIFKISKPKYDCDKCTLCTTKCSMGLPLYKMDDVRGGECINCLKCVDVCPKKNAQSNILGEDINPPLAGSVAIATLAGVYSINSFTGTILSENNKASVTSTVSSTDTTPSKKYKDGTFTGTGTGFKGGTTKISVTISDGKITSIETVTHGDTPSYYERTIGTITDEIISSQSTSVDTVSGATYSSRGIIDAVQDALNQAMGISSSSTDTTTSSDATNSYETRPERGGRRHNDEAPFIPEEKNDTTSTNDNNNSNSNTNIQQEYTDGTYTGSGTGFRNATTTVSVTVSGGKITSIETISHGDTPHYYERTIETITDEIISSQSTSVDTVSGATFSSRGIIEAVENALNQAL